MLPPTAHQGFFIARDTDAKKIFWVVRGPGGAGGAVAQLPGAAVELPGGGYGHGVRRAPGFRSSLEPPPSLIPHPSAPRVLLLPRQTPFRWLCCCLPCCRPGFRRAPARAATVPSPRPNAPAGRACGAPRWR
jgi:hypothetical protein